MPLSARRVPHLGWLIGACLLASLPPSAGAQGVEPDTAVRDSAFSAECDGRVVTTVTVDTRRPEFRGNLARWRRFARSIGLHHATTRDAIVRRFVTLEPGRPCTEFRRAESERILRTQPYLATATVRTRADGDSGTIVEVETVDESSAIVGGRLRRGRIAGISLGNENLFGLAVRLQAEAEHGFAYRDGIGGSFTHHQLFGRPYTLTLEGRRLPVGDEWRVEAGHAFLTDLQRIAWHAGVVGRHDYLGLRRLERDETTLPVHVRRFDVGGVLRFGPPGRLGLFGGVVTGERVRPATQAVIVTDSGFVAPPADGAALAYEPYEATRLAVVAGVRALKFRTARGLDALAGEQDIARGVQVGLLAGRGLTALGSTEEDLLVGGDLFAAVGGPWSYIALRVEGEGRRAAGRDVWDGVVGSGRAAWYLKEAAHWTLILGAEGVAGWDARLPLGLSLSDRDGVRGVRREDTPVGARRLVTRAEQRWSGGAIRNADVGLAAFVDAGRLWAGDVPYGESTGTAASVGLSLLAAVPRGGQRLYRLDVAMPLNTGHRRLQVRVSTTDPTRTFWEEPEKVARARSTTGATRVLSWP